MSNILVIRRNFNVDEGQNLKRFPGFDKKLWLESGFACNNAVWY